MMNTFNIFTLFPDMFKALDYGILAIATTKGIININTVNIREYSTLYIGESWMITIMVAEFVCL